MLVNHLLFAWILTVSLTLNLFALLILFILYKDLKNKKEDTHARKALIKIVSMLGNQSLSTLGQMIKTIALNGLK